MNDGGDPVRSPGWSFTWPVRAAVAIALAMVGIGLLWAAVGSTAIPQAVPASSLEVPSPTAAAVSPRVTSSTRPPPSRTSVRDRILGPVLPESDPVTVSIPRIAVESRVVHLGLDGKGELEVPRDPAVAGWFSRSAAPGALGPAVIAGHVTWNGAHGVFYRLGTLHAGDQVLVERKDRRIAVFTVTRVARFSKSRFPTAAVYGEVDNAALRLITCGGTYDRASHRYLDNVVVFARLTDARTRHS